MKLERGTGPQSRESHDSARSEEHTSELQSRLHLVCRLLLEKKKNKKQNSSHCHNQYPRLCLKKQTSQVQSPIDIGRYILRSLTKAKLVVCQKTPEHDRRVD